MKYTDHGFRPLYKNFCIYSLDETLKSMLKDQPGVGNAEGAMVYGYVDHAQGNMLEVLALTKKEEGGKFSYLNLAGEERVTLKMETLMDAEFDFVDYGDSHFYEKFKSKVDVLKTYDVNENIAKSRTFAFLDEFRFENNFDDVKVILYKDGLKLEGAWVRIEELGKGVIMGTLLTEPEQDFGAELGSPIVFIVNETEDKKKQLIADFTSRKKFKAEDLSDGKMLKEAIETFNADKNKIKFFVVLEMLRDSNVFVPYTKKGVDILSSNHKYYFPVFSSLVEMWEYGEGISKISMPFLDAIKKAIKADKNVEGIVVNAFTDSVVIPKSLFDMIQGLESRVENDEQ